jgi:phosphate transport system substrate-binding protein
MKRHQDLASPRSLTPCWTTPLTRASTLVLALALTACGGGAGGGGGTAPSGTSGAGSGGRDQIRIVGSSTVYPFATKVAEQFGRKTRFKTPVIESTGSGGGFKLFCAGLGVRHPDISNASRAIKPSEIELCARNGVTEITEVKIGFDGIVIANQKGADVYDLSRRDLYLALAKEVPDGDGGIQPNPYQSWHEIDPNLPEAEIEVFGPPPTSGTRDAFVELVMEPGCKEFEAVAALEDQDEDRFKEVCQRIREDGRYIEAGENDNLIVQKLGANPAALGIFGFSFLDQNRDVVQGSRVEGIEPTFDNIASGEYPVSRPLFFYVKDAHVGVIPGIKEYVQEFLSDGASGPEGYLADIGLIPLPEADREQVRQEALAFADNVD